MPLTFARLLSYPANAPYWTPEMKYTPVCLLDHLQLAPLKHLRSCKERRYSSRVLSFEKNCERLHVQATSPPSLTLTYLMHFTHVKVWKKKLLSGACSMPWKEKAIKRRGLGEWEPRLSFFSAFTFVFGFPTTKNLCRTGWRRSLLAEVSHSKRKLIGKRDTSADLRRVLSYSRDHLFGWNLLVFKAGFVESVNVDYLQAVSYFSSESP